MNNYLLPIAVLLMLCTSSQASNYDEVSTVKLNKLLSSLYYINEFEDKCFKEDRTSDKFVGNELEDILDLIKANADPNASPNGSCATALSYVAHNNNIEAARYLLDKGANAKTILSGQDCAFIAAKCGHKAIFKMLINCGSSGSSRGRVIDPDIQKLINSWQRTYNEDINEPMLHELIRMGLSERTLEHAIRGIPESEREELINQKDNLGLTALDLAFLVSSYPMINEKRIAVLLEYGAQPTLCKFNCLQRASRCKEIPPKILDIIFKRTKERYTLFLHRILRKNLTTHEVSLIVDFILKSYFPTRKYYNLLPADINSFVGNKTNG